MYVINPHSTTLWSQFVVSNVKWYRIARFAGRVRVRCSVESRTCTSRGRRQPADWRGAHAPCTLPAPPRKYNREKYGGIRHAKTEGVRSAFSRWGSMLIHRVLRPFFRGGGWGMGDAIKKPRVRVGARLETRRRTEWVCHRLFLLFS